MDFTEPLIFSASLPAAYRHVTGDAVGWCRNDAVETNEVVQQLALITNVPFNRFVHFFHALDGAHHRAPIHAVGFFSVNHNSLGFKGLGLRPALLVNI